MNRKAALSKGVLPPWSEYRAEVEKQELDDKYQEQHRIAGAKGGKTTARRHGSTYYQTIGQKGGDAMFRKYGREHFVRAGKKSAEVRRARKEGNEA